MKKSYHSVTYKEWSVKRCHFGARKDASNNNENSWDFFFSIFNFCPTVLICTSHDFQKRH